MTEENQNLEIKNEKHTCNCICHSEAFRKIIVIAVGSFVGVFSALSLFAALHRPPMMPLRPMFYGGMHKPCHCKMYHQFNAPNKFVRGERPQRPDFKKFDKKFNPEQEIDD